MRKEVHISNWLFLSRFFLQFRKNYGMAILMIFTFGLFSNVASAQLNLEDFSGGIPATWAITSSQTVTNNWIATTPAEGYLGTPGAKVNPALNNTVGTTAEYFLISPQFTTPNNPEIRFWTKQGSFVNKGAVYQLRLSTATQPDISSFNVVVASWTEAQLNTPATTYAEKIVPLPSIPQGIPVYLAFVAVTNQDASNLSGTSGDIWFVDNVRVIESCAKVAGITSIMSANSGNINWTHPLANNFEIQIGDENFAPAATGTPVNGTSFNATNLTTAGTPPLNNGTTYDVYIKTICDATTASGWAGPFKITTAKLGLSCATPIVIPANISTTPYVLSTNLDTFHDTQNYTPLDSESLSCQPFGSTQNWLYGDHAFLSYTPATSGLVNVNMAVTTNYSTGCYNNLSSVFIFDSCNIGTTANCLGSITTGQSSGATSGQIQNMYMLAGQTYYFVISSPFPHSDTQPGASICFTFTLSQPSCPIPSGLSYNNLTQTSATFSWDNPQNLVSNWEYVVKTSPVTPNGTDVINPAGTNSNNPSPVLTAATTYYVYVRSVCGGTPGAWSAPLTFRTPCNILPLPYCNGFEDSAKNDCWSQLNLNNDSDFFHFGNNGFNEPVAKLRTSNAGTNTNDMLISPQFHLDGVTQKRLRFKYNIYGNWGLIVDNPTGGPGSFEVKISTTGIGGQNFTTTVVPLASYTTAYNFIEMVVPLPNIVGDINIAWIIPSGANQTGTWIYIDDVCIEDLPACSEPSYPIVNVSSITSTSAQVSWTNGYNSSQWELVAQPLGTGTPTTPPATGAVVNIVNTNPYTITGLDPSTRYEFYVRTYCSSTLQSTWAGPANFNTLCIAQPTPYYESFNDTDVNTKKFCWSTNNVDDDPAEWRISGTEASIYPQPVNFFEPFASYNDWLISAPVNAVGAKRVRFKYRVVTSPFFPAPRGNFEVLMSSTPDFSTYTTLIPMHDFANPSFMEDSVLFNGTGVTYFAFRLPPNMSDPSNTGIIVVDDFVVENAPPCPNPSHLTVSNVTSSTANMSWTAGNVENKWEIVIQQQGGGIPTGSGTTVNNTPSYNATGLTPDRPYEYYIRAVCNATESSEWVGPVVFRTACNPLQTPFFETFDTTSSTESCWKIVNDNADGNSWSLNQTVQPIAGDQMAALFTGMNGDNNDWLITPTLKARAGQRLRFSYKVYNNFFEEDLKVMLSTGGTATSQFSTILYENNYATTTDASGTTAGSNTITVASSQRVRVGDRVYIPDFPIPYGTTVIAKNGLTITLSENATVTQAGVLHVEFIHEVINNEETREMVINLTDITSPTDINIGFHTPFYPANPWNYRGQYTFIDNVIVEDIPVCPPVINLVNGNITDTTAIINWGVAGTETSWELSVQPFGTPAPVGSTLPQYLHTASAHPYTVTGLTPSTRYQVYVRAVCSGSSQSTWVGPIDILTKCDMANVCQYTISLSNGNTGQVYRGLNVVQNGTVIQTLTFPIDAPNQPTVLDHQVFLCTGVEFSLYWDGSGSGTQYSEAQAVIKDQSGNVVWTSPLGLGTINTNIYTGTATCGAITCPQPTNLTVSNTGVLSWTSGGSETQWEVAIQPLGHGTIPQSGVVISNGIPSYTPQASDFFYPLAGTNEYFVRAVCGSSKSYWTGPKVFIKNDEPTTAIRLQVNSNGTCSSQGTNASFIGATASNIPTTCGGTNGGDIWYEFVATSKVHTVELSNFNPGSYYTSSYQGVWPKVMMSLYEVQSNGSLVEKACSDNNSLVTMYSSELVVGNTYKVRLTLNASGPNDKRFDICVSAPADTCNMNAFNYSFEKLPMQNVTGISTIIDATVIPGWRVNTDWQTVFYQESTLGDAIAYEGGQYLQLTQDGADDWDPNDPNIKGLYKDFDTSEITVMDYSFASATRRTNGTGTTVQLFAGPPSGPFTVIAEDHADSLIWDLIQGSYTVPNGQTKTRFIFRVVENAIGHILDAANFKANIRVKNDAITLGCSQASTLVEAEGIGEWSADASNPAVTTIDTPSNKTATVSGFATPGVYIYHWKTRYCDSTVTVTYQGVTTLPTVTAQVDYCSNQTATALTAVAPANHTLLWFTQPTGGTGSTTAPIPDTSVTGSVIYYVSAVDANGCIGPRAAIEVTVNPTVVPNVGFSYDNVLFCKNDPNPVITIDPNFTSGGTFSAQPNGLDIDSVTGEINLLGSSGGAYTVTYEILQNGCTNAASNSVSLTIDASCVDIPRGISPNNDGSNETFDLTGLDVRSLIIYNRYGTEVYAFSGNYTTQWKGQSNKGEKLPDGTYFYTVTKADGSTVTGWVYINR
ncbi:choice-of-anchor J domain-containing protein [Flavobacterium amniphilum]|uniref:choice-of-anchor J domain-containing protein n=1 Tax=Flavobacterium amniphilum TaxID=1834035 RepID=UPI002029F784|nr:choice-of-anchor J domain-containing protein [Flavobacterium amniphilum]MCL9805799.1 choice-of-anchor J domain-containing protein [Flavobacterium amniphilum]MCL9806386.1 choice-of-anchor J domain-containing protein [Flavobacterium amniphilum]